MAEGRGEEERRGELEVMMWQRQKGLEKFHHKGPNMQVFPQRGILGSRFDLGLKSGPRLWDHLAELQQG